MTLLRPLSRSRRLAFAGLLLTATVCFADVRVWLLVNAERTDSVLSNDRKEREGLEHGKWRVDGTGNLHLEPGADTVPVHRLFNPAGGRKLEVDPARLKMWTEQGFVEEGVLGYASAKPGAGLVAVHHLTKNGKDLWLISAATRAAAVKAGWKPEPTRFWLWPAEPDSTPAEAGPQG
jgi:hypothetical protein